MPRPRRTILQDVTYHCFTRCHGRKNLFNRSFVKQYFVDAINMCHEKYEFEIIAAEPVGDHIHLLIHTLEGEENIFNRTSPLYRAITSIFRMIVSWILICIYAIPGIMTDQSTEEPTFLFSVPHKICGDLLLMQNLLTFRDSF